MQQTTTLVETLADPVKRAAVVRDGVLLIDREMARKSGIRGTMVRTGYKTVRAIHPGIIDKALDKLLPKFAPAVDPHYTKALASGDVEQYFVDHKSEIANALLSVTDAQAKRAKNRVILKVYNGLRGQAQGHVEEAMPGLAGLIEAHTS